MSNLKSIVHVGDAATVLRTLPARSADCCITSPPYFGLRDYGVDGQLGLEATPEAYVATLVDVFREVRRVLRDEGTLWVVMGDSYAGSGKGRNADGSHQEGGKQGTNHGTVAGKLRKTDTGSLKPKDLIGIPWRLAFALQADGWYLRQDIIWHKPNPMPESVRDRCTKAHEYIFLLAKSSTYYVDWQALQEPAIGKSAHDLTGPGYSAPGQAPNKGNRKAAPTGFRNRRSVWTVATSPFKGAHFATFPPNLIRPCILAGCPDGGVVLDPFAGAGTTGVVALQQGRQFVGVELNAAYAAMATQRIAGALTAPAKKPKRARITAPLA